MKVAVLGFGRMGGWFADNLKADCAVAVLDTDSAKTKNAKGVKVLLKYEDLAAFAPDVLINAVNHNSTFEAFDEAIKYVSDKCIIGDVAAVKDGLSEYYSLKNRKFFSLHPMFRPADNHDYSSEFAVIINESDSSMRDYFTKYFDSFKIKIYQYSFEEHDEMTASALAVPFISSMVFASCTKLENVPGNTYKKHMDITRSLMSEDDYVLAEILFNPKALAEIEKINSKLSYLTHIIKAEDFDEVHKFFENLRSNIK
ncbi:MAG TPA: prephenate dehydrogenase/arogenate dehydrogenase family protein [Spirochaetota bacterium]|nr:prephenate dehydrogenase/arogenate dehydrogenase family protein [Spirochaetota bacterium]HQE58618.1 prephenate dehydrogenase/arogenate dehydrogenase family protein [Spirochaetota bacterium]